MLCGLPPPPRVGERSCLLLRTLSMRPARLAVCTVAAGLAGVRLGLRGLRLGLPRPRAGLNALAGRRDPPVMRRGMYSVDRSVIDGRAVLLLLLLLLLLRLLTSGGGL